MRLYSSLHTYNGAGGQPGQAAYPGGFLNGLILPVTLGTMLLASRRKDIVGDYHHPTWLLVFGVIIVVIAGYSGILSLGIWHSSYQDRPGKHTLDLLTGKASGG